MGGLCAKEGGESVNVTYLPRVTVLTLAGLFKQLQRLIPPEACPAVHLATRLHGHGLLRGWTMGNDNCHDSESLP